MIKLIDLGIFCSTFRLAHRILKLSHSFYLGTRLTSMVAKAEWSVCRIYNLQRLYLDIPLTTCLTGFWEESSGVVFFKRQHSLFWNFCKRRLQRRWSIFVCCKACSGAWAWSGHVSQLLRSFFLSTLLFTLDLALNHQPPLAPCALHIHTLLDKRCWSQHTPETTADTRRVPPAAKTPHHWILCGLLPIPPKVITPTRNCHT